MSSNYANMIKSLIGNPSYTMDSIKQILKGYKDANIITEEEVIELTSSIEAYYSLDTLKAKQIELTKLNLSKYLEENPLFSTIKHEEGRYYTVTQDKQQQLTSTLLMCSGYMQAGLEYELTWNDAGNVCEAWSYDELFVLASQINAYVKPLITLQQETEVEIKNATTKEEILSIDINPYGK